MTTNHRQHAPASFTIYAEGEEEPTQEVKASRADLAYMITSGAIIAAIGIALVHMAAGLMHADKVSTGQAAQIHALNQANARMSLQLSQMNSALNGQNPSTDPDLLTCADLRKMGLTITAGGSVSSVPGTVSLSQIPVRIPAHCAKR